MPLSSADIVDFKNKGVIVIHSDCDVIAANDKSLPVDSYLVTCKYEDLTWHDIVKGLRVPIFDSYYDAFGQNVMEKMVWTKGTVPDKFWCRIDKEKKKK